MNSDGILNVQPLMRQVDVNRYRIEESLSVGTTLLYKKEHILESDPNFFVHVNKGFITDGASVPRAFWNVISPFGRHTVAAIIHDKLYHTPLITSVNTKAVFHIGKVEADRIFRELLIRSDCAAWKRRIMYSAVCLFGKKAWNNHREREDNYYGRD